MQKHISDGIDDFQWLVLNILCQEMILDLRTIHNMKIYFEDFKDLLANNLVTFLCFDHCSWLVTLSTKQKFCWVILATCCSKITISYDDFGWARRYRSIIHELDLGRVFLNYCKEKKLSKENCIIASKLPKEITSHPSEHLRM